MLRLLKGHEFKFPESNIRTTRPNNSILEDPFDERNRGNINGLFMNPTKTKTNKVYLVKLGK